MGNQACDLDSMVSSMALAYLNDIEAREGSLRHIPILPIKRNEFSSRTEAVWLFKEVNLSIGDLTFLDDIPNPKVQNQNCSFLLVALITFVVV
jgi:exopolyphosphatase